MATVDWIALIVPVLVVLAIAFLSKRYLKSVADYMAGGRNAGRYMLCVARAEMGSGAVVFAALFEVFARAGFTMTWWYWISIPVMTFVAISGFVVYRYRETRAMTLAQFFEMRYSRSFRIFTGFVGFIAGVLNFGIIPAVGARFFVYFMGLPPEVTLAGFTIPMFVILMILFMTVTIILTISGGQITVMLTDCASGLMDSWLFLAVIATLLVMFDWSQVTEALLMRPPGQSMINPFDSLGNKDFNLWFVLMGLFLSTYGTMAWQNASAYNAAARTPHESRMGNLLGRWREFAKQLTVTILAAAAVTFLMHPDFAAQAAAVPEVLDGIANPQIQRQMTIPTALSVLLPAGTKGLLCAILITGVFGGDSTHLHSWGSMFIQDVVLPLRGKPFAPRNQIKMLRLSMIGVGVFAVIFGSLFSQTEYIAMWFRITTTIYVGGAGAVIIGGLYWKKGTTAGAWTALIGGAVLSLAGILIRQKNPQFPLNGMQISFVVMLISIASYVAVSLLTCKRDFNMDRLLHRGKYAVAEDAVKVDAEPLRKRFRWSKLIGISEKFSRGDRWIAGGLFWYGVFWFVVMLIGSLWNAIQPWSNAVWSSFWLWAAILIPMVISVVTTVWFTIGVMVDLRNFFNSLLHERVDVHDDGRVERYEDDDS
jgi:solute:Na+ symporter, SSS family